MEIQENISLKPYNTFGLDVFTSKFVEVSNVEELQEILMNNNDPLLILGGGSNILFTQNFNGLVIKNNITGITVLEESNKEIVLKVGAGEV